MAKNSDIVASYFEIFEIVESEFVIIDSYIRDGIPTFHLDPTPNIHEKINRLRVKLQERGLDIILQKRQDDLVLMAVALRSKPISTRFSRPVLRLILLLATIVTVTISGWINASSFVTMLEILKLPTPSKIGLTVMYTVSLMGVLGLHEIGHMIASYLHHEKPSPPFFIPGIPGVGPGTFGAVIIQEKPIVNRDQLFDLGYAGPLLSFITALIVSYFGYSWSVPVTRAQYLEVINTMGPGQSFFLPVIFMVFGRYIFPSPNSYTHFLHPVAWAGWILTLITFLNALPIGQLDGGHVFRALLGPKWHRRFSYITIGILFIVGWWEWALLTLFLIRTTHPGVLDDVTEVSTKRKIAGIFFILIAITCFIPAPRNLLTMFFR